MCSTWNFGTIDMTWAALRVVIVINAHLWIQTNKSKAHGQIYIKFMYTCTYIYIYY